VSWEGLRPSQSRRRLGVLLQTDSEAQAVLKRVRKLHIKGDDIAVEALVGVKVVEVESFILFALDILPLLLVTRCLHEPRKTPYALFSNYQVEFILEFLKLRVVLQ